MRLCRTLQKYFLHKLVFEANNLLSNGVGSVMLQGIRIWDSERTQKLKCRHTIDCIYLEPSRLVFGACNLKQPKKHLRLHLSIYTFGTPARVEEPFFHRKNSRPEDQSGCKCDKGCQPLPKPPKSPQQLPASSVGIFCDFVRWDPKGLVCLAFLILH